MNSRPLLPRLAAPLLITCFVLTLPSTARAQADDPELTQAIAQFREGQWQSAMEAMQSLLDGGSLKRSDRSQARKYLAMGALLLGRDDQLAVDLFKDLVADDPYFRVAALAERPGQDPPSDIVRLFAEGQFRWRQEEQERRLAQLSSTSRTGAMLRSVVLPGTGQFYQGYRGRGYGMIALTGAAAAYAIVSDLNYRSARDDYDSAEEGADFARLYRDYETAANRADIALGVVAAAWIYNVLDAALSGPNLSGLSRPVTARVAPGDDGRGARLEFALAF